MGYFLAIMSRLLQGLPSPLDEYNRLSMSVSISDELRKTQSQMTAAKYFTNCVNTFLPREMGV